jgi:putative ABC transport system permease protein
MKKYPWFFVMLGLTLFLGTMSLVSINLIAGQVQGKLQNSAHQLLTSDLSVSARRDFFPKEAKALEILLNNYPHQRYKIIDIYSMVTRTQFTTSRLVEIRATENKFPFYGSIRLNRGKFSSSKLYISRNLSDLWRIKVGEKLKIGEVSLPVSGIVEDDSSLGLRGFSLAPRIYFPLEKLDKTGLLKPGATGNFSYHYKFLDLSKDEIKTIKNFIYKQIKDTAVKVTLPEDSSEQTGRVINLLTNFMSLSGLIGLILSLVGVFYLYQSHLIARLRDFSLLNLYGMHKVQIVQGVVVQFSLIFLFVFFIELVLVISFYRMLSPLISSYLGLSLDLNHGIDIMKVLIEMPFLYLLSLFILIPILFGLMRTSMIQQIKVQKHNLGKFRFLDFLPFTIMLWAFSSYLAKSLKIGSLFFFSLIFVFLVSSVLIKSLQWFLRKFISNKGFLIPTIENGLALRSIVRSGHKMTLTFLSLTLGSTLISFILQLDSMILNEFTFDVKKPSLFIFDIQEEQVDSFTTFAQNTGASLSNLTPMIRARLEKVNGIKFVKNRSDFDPRSNDGDDEDRLRNNGVNLTYRRHLNDSERIIKGEPFPEGEVQSDRLPYISLEKRWSQRMNISIGDQLTFDIQGVEFKGIVRNLREVKWTSFYPNFFVTIEPGPIEAAPKTFLAVLPRGPRKLKLSLQRQTVSKFPNISFIDVEELVSKLTDLFKKSRQAVVLISWLSLFVGLLILYGLSHDQVYRRKYDLALLKSLGLSSLQLRLNLLYEFGGLFLTSLGLGLFLGWLIAQVIGKEIFKISFGVDWFNVFIPAVFLSFLCLITILLASWRSVREKPLILLSDS